MSNTALTLKKYCVIGQKHIGKSKLVQAIIDGPYIETYKPTIGADFYHYPLSDNETKFTAQIWDVAGDEKYQSATIAYYNETNVFVLCFDYTNKCSLSKLTGFLTKVRGQDISPETSFILVGTKYDDFGKRQVTEADIKGFKKENVLDDATLVNTSAKTQNGIELLKKVMHKSATSSCTMQPTHFISAFLFGMASAACGVSSAALITTAIALTVALSAVWPLGLAVGGATLLLGAGFFAYKSYQKRQDSDTESSKLSLSAQI